MLGRYCKTALPWERKVGEDDQFATLRSRRRFAAARARPGRHAARPREPAKSLAIRVLAPMFRITRELNNGRNAGWAAH